ncbi:MAG TPA: hypothetical protein VM534_10935 [Thermoanaerobaculia bacterium]|nr:hypothetical protein [Thermoanaerobaculia bacterium]
MDERDRAEHPEMVNPETHHESRDINVRAVLWFVAIMTVFGIVVHVGLWWFFGLLREREQSLDPARWTAIAPTEEVLPPEPRLQVSPVSEMQAFREQEEKRLNSYGWVDREKGIVHLPVEQAMELVLQRGILEEQAVEPAAPGQPSPATPQASLSAETAAGTAEGQQP